VITARELPVRPLDFLRARVPRHAEDVVVVAHCLKARYHARLMADIKDCPLCGDSMRLKVREVTDRVPGTGQTTTRQVREWFCPECDYFEEAEDDER
jgi:YgiT-type zinc finger domain-containing protein